MIDNQELVFVVDENNDPLQPQLRSNAHKNNLWHRTSGIWIINRNKQILCQKRSLKKDTKPGMWEAFFGGHIAPDEDAILNAANEVNEELGIRIDKNKLVSYKIIKSDEPDHKEFQHIFALLLHEELTTFAFEKDEIDQLQWISINDLKEILMNKKPLQWVRKPWEED